MRKPTSALAMGVLAASLLFPSMRSYADDNPPGNHRQREELRHVRGDLERLRDQRQREIREGDRRAAREYNEKIRDKRKRSGKTVETFTEMTASVVATVRPTQYFLIVFAEAGRRPQHGSGNARERALWKVNFSELRMIDFREKAAR